MKKLLLFGSFLATGLLSAETHLSYYERIALQTSSPRVHLTKAHKHKKASDDETQNDVAKSGYRVEKNKTTVVAFVPVGK